MMKRFRSFSQSRAEGVFEARVHVNLGIPAQVRTRKQTTTVSTINENENDYCIVLLHTMNERVSSPTMNPTAKEPYLYISHTYFF